MMMMDLKFHSGLIRDQGSSAMLLKKIDACKDGGDLGRIEKLNCILRRN